MTKDRIEQLETLCLSLRHQLIDLLHSIQTGHPGGSLSCTEILATLYFEKMNLYPQNPSHKNRDRFVLSKGHAAPMLYLMLAHKGFFPVDELPTLRQMNSRLQGHPCAHKTPGVEISTGPLGLGLSAGLGMALSGRLAEKNYYTYVLLGDGELQEGAVWEAAMSAAKYKANRLIAIVDYNKVQLDGTNDEIMPLGDLQVKFTSFGWNVYSCDGHSISALAQAIDRAKESQVKPSVILADTVKGKGISFMEHQHSWHGQAIDAERYQKAKKELGGTLHAE